MEQQSLYRQYNFDEPWDGPNNRKLWDQIPYFYTCKGCERCRRIGGEPFGKMPRNASNYVAIVGDETAWPAGKKVSWPQVVDGTSQTLLVLEYTGMTQPWTAPVDLTLEEAIEQLTGSDDQGHLAIDETLVTATFDGSRRMIGFYAGSVHHVPNSLSEPAARALLTIAGGETLRYEPESWMGSRAMPQRVTVIRYDRAYALLAFVALALWPAVGMWRRVRPPV